MGTHPQRRFSECPRRVGALGGVQLSGLQPQAASARCSITPSFVGEFPACPPIGAKHWPKCGLRLICSFADESQEAREDEFRDGSLPPNRGMDRGAAKPCLYRSFDDASHASMSFGTLRCCPVPQICGRNWALDALPNVRRFHAERISAKSIS